MYKSSILPVILAGGYGERLWPLSRSTYPKQFIDILRIKISLFQATLQRLPKTQQFLPPLIICNNEHRFLVAEQIRQISVQTSGVILEPIAKNTAPAVALATIWAKSKNSNIHLLILPSDHYISNFDILLSLVKDLLPITNDQKIITFGIKATSPEIGYGYIEKGRNIKDNLYIVKQFIEKPDINTAQHFINDNFLWNSGMFLCNHETILNELNKYAPKIAKCAENAFIKSIKDTDFIRINTNDYEQMPNISIDYAVIEKTKTAVVTPIDCSWSDVGNWNSVWKYHKNKDSSNNVLKGNIVVTDTRNCLIEARHRLVTAANIENIIIVETNNAVLVTKRENASNLKKLVNKLKLEKYEEAHSNNIIMRPWGYYNSLLIGNNFQVKLLVLQCSRSISLQLHKHRIEHWIIVHGKAKVVRDQETFLLDQNQYTFIPKGIKHQLINVGKKPLEVIEVQSGDYLGEDDIIRF